MATEYIGLPGHLLAKVKEAAAKEEITPEELVRDAIEVRLSRAEWAKTLAFGDRDARDRGLNTSPLERNPLGVELSTGAIDVVPPRSLGVSPEFVLHAPHAIRPAMERDIAKFGTRTANSLT